MTLTELKSLIQDYLQNTETTFVNNLNEIIKNAEERLFEEVEFDFFRKTTTGTLTAGSRLYTAPSDFVLAFSFTVKDSSDDYNYLIKKHPSFLLEYDVDPTDSSKRGLPKYYADYDKELFDDPEGSTLVVAPVPDSNYTFKLNYLYKPTSLTSNSSGTWLSQNARNGLLYACLLEAYTFMKGDPDLLQLYETRYNQELARLKNRAEARGRKDEYRYDSLRKPVT